MLHKSLPRWLCTLDAGTTCRPSAQHQISAPPVICETAPLLRLVLALQAGAPGLQRSSALHNSPVPVQLGGLQEPRHTSAHSHTSQRAAHPFLPGWPSQSECHLEQMWVCTPVLREELPRAELHRLDASGLQSQQICGLQAPQMARRPGIETALEIVLNCT